MPQPRFTEDPSQRRSARARGAVTPPDAPEVVASTEPDDDLSDYLVPEEPVLDPEPSLDDQLPTGVLPATDDATAAEVPDSAPQITTADTELVRQLEAELARARARLAGQHADVSTWSVAPAPVDPKDGEVVVIHVRKDGFTANGRVWYKGQELEFLVGSQQWKDTCDRSGKSWVVLSDVDQIRRYGEVQFGHGSWPGEPFANEKAAAAEHKRARKVPAITQLASMKTKL